MNRFFCLLLGFVFSMQVSAAPVSHRAAQEKARLFMIQQGMINAESQAEIASFRLAPNADAVQRYYIFNAGNARGFVVVAGDDRVDSILGYCDTGTFDEADIPENMQTWLRSIDGEIEWMQAHVSENTSFVSSLRAPKPAIAPLISTKWDQGRPYNLLCPGNSYTGCVATAIAQVMNYHQWPDTTRMVVPGMVSNGDTIRNLPITAFDWDAMKNTYYGNDPDGQAVAELMLYVGCSVNMSYSTSGSGAHNEDVPSALINYFGYDPSLRLAYRDRFLIDEWNDLIYNELANGRPVYYSGASMSVGHAFVCDGYDGAGLFHINWGWGGRFDGHFKLSLLNPESVSGAGSGSTPDGYPNQQCALLGVQKPTDDAVEIFPVKPNLYAFNVQQQRLEVIFSKQWGDKRIYDCALAVENGDGSYNILAQKRFNTSVQSRFSIYCNVDTLLEEVGDYKLVALGRETTDSIWSRVGLAYDYVSLSITSENELLNYSFVVHPVFNLTATSIEPVGPIRTKDLNPLKVTISNNGDEYNGMIYIYACKEHEIGNTYPHGYTTVALHAGETADLTLYFQPSSLQDMAIWLFVDNPNNYYLDCIGVRELANYNLEFVGATVSYDPLEVKVKLRNNSDTDYNGSFRALIYQNGRKKVLGKTDQTKLIPAGGEAVFVYDTFRLTSGIDYYMQFQAQLQEFSDTFSLIDGRVDIDGSQVSGVKDLTVDDEIMTEWYSITGTRTRQPSGKGVFIRNGKKFVR